MFDLLTIGNNTLKPKMEGTRTLQLIGGTTIFPIKIKKPPARHAWRTGGLTGEVLLLTRSRLAHTLHLAAPVRVLAEEGGDISKTAGLGELLTGLPP